MAARGLLIDDPIERDLLAGGSSPRLRPKGLLGEGLKRIENAGKDRKGKPGSLQRNLAYMQDALTGFGGVAGAPLNAVAGAVAEPVMRGVMGVLDRVPSPDNLLTFKGRPGEKPRMLGDAARQSARRMGELVDAGSDALGYDRELGRELAMTGAGLLAPSVARGVGRVADAAEGLINKAGRSFKRPGNVMMSGGGPVRSRSWSAPKLGDETVAVYHGTGGDHANLMPQSMNVLSSGSREGPIGVWTTNDPRVASSFADFSARGSGANVRPLAIKLKNPLELKSYDEIRDLVDKFTQFERPGYVVGGRQIRMMGDKVDYDGLRAFLRDQGYDGIALRQTLMDSLDGQPIDQFISLDSQSVSPRFGGLLSQPVKLADDGIIAYHGSPHSFDKFSMDKIGTGEGAQAYGHGLYFAEAEDVAKTYRDALAPHGQLKTSSGTIDTNSITDPVQRTASMALMRDSQPHNAKYIAGNWSLPDGVTREQVNAAIDELASKSAAPAGNMYQVRLNVKPDELLDWDKPLSKQPEIWGKIRGESKLQTQQAILSSGERLAAFAQKTGVAPIVGVKLQGELRRGLPIEEAFASVRNLGGTIQDTDKRTKWLLDVDKLEAAIGGEQLTMRGDVPGDWTGAVIAKNIPGMKPDEIAETLKARGIKGIRYKDAGSRGAEGGTYNYVVFDDKLITILKKYGIPMTVGAGGAMMVAGQDMPPELAAQMAPAA